MARTSRRHQLAACCWLALSGAVVFASDQAAALAQPQPFDIAAGSAAEKLREFGKQAGLQTLFDYELLKTIRTQAVTGTMEPEAALTRMLDGTGLTFERTDASTIAIRPTNAGNGSSEVPAAPAAGDGDVTELYEVIVTGTNIRMTASEIDQSALPVEVITTEKLQMTASEQVGSYLRAQPFVSGDNLQPLNDGFNGGRTALNLRGLGAAYTLVLADGRRFASEDSISDIGSIPPEAIESVEVLKSGASAIFGSAAVGGVVNFKLRNKFEGVELFASGGNTTNHDAAYYRGAMLFGKTFDRFRVVGSLSHSERNGIERFDREYTANSDHRRFGGFDRRIGVWGRTGVIQIPSRPGERLILDLSRFQPGQTGTSPADYIPFDPNLHAFSAGAVSTVPPQTRTSGHWIAEYDLMDGRVVLFSKGFFDENKVPNKLAQVIMSNLVVPANNPYNPFGEPATVTYIFGLNELSPVLTHHESDSVSTLFGVRGDLGEYTYEIGFGRAQYKQIADVGAHDVARTLAAAAAARTDATALNPFGYWANSPEQVANLSVDHAASSHNRLDMIDARLSGPLFNLPAGPLRFAVGAERRESENGFGSDDVWKTTSFYNGSMRGPDNSYSRKVNAFFGELRIPLYDAQGAFLDSIELGTAARYEDYSDFGSTDVKQANLRFGLMNDEVILRASFAEGFRAPYVEDLVEPQSSFIATGFFDPVRGGFLPITVITGGNPDLKPETADTYNFGLIYSPRFAERLTFRADYWKAELTDRIVTPSTNALLEGSSSVGSITRAPVTGDVTIDGRLVNGGTLEASGIDFGASYTLPTGSLGRFVVDLNTTYTLDYIDGSVGTTDIVGTFNSNVLASLPKLRGVFSTYWSSGGWDAGLTFNYQSGVRDTVVSPPIDRKTPDYVTANLHVSYDFGEAQAFGGTLNQLSAYMGIENLWDETIPFVAGSPSGFDRSLVDYRGRYIYAGLRKRF